MIGWAERRKKQEHPNKKLAGHYGHLFFVVDCLVEVKQGKLSKELGMFLFLMKRDYM